MFELKTLNLRLQWDGQYPRIASALPALALVYGFWIADADLDGFRIDAAKHMGEESPGAFCDIIRGFAQVAIHADGVHLRPTDGRRRERLPI